MRLVNRTDGADVANGDRLGGVVLRKAVFYTLKGHVLQDKRPPFAKRFVSYWLSTSYTITLQQQQNATPKLPDVKWKRCF